MTCKRTHQLKRRGDYWTIARTLCGKEAIRDKTTTTDLKVTCAHCKRHILMIMEQKMAKLVGAKQMKWTLR